MRQQNPLHSVIVPLYNEEEVIHETYRRLTEVLSAMTDAYEIVFVNDGSRDKTEAMAMGICAGDPRVKMVNFARNFGHQVAITAGMDFAAGDTLTVIDGDLQDPPEVILQMIEQWRQGYDVVYGQRVEREGETFFKKITAKVFYRTLKRMTDFDIPVDAGDFRLIDRKVADALKRINERNRYIRGLISWLGFRQTAVHFHRQKRFAGVTKYPLKKMIKFAMDAITSFSYKPLRLASYLGFFLSSLSFLYLLVVICQALFTRTTQPGWASAMAVSLFFNGVVLVILGMIGEYVGRIYDEAKNRPLYVVRDLINIENEDLYPRK